MQKLNKCVLVVPTQRCLSTGFPALQKVYLSPQTPIRTDDCCLNAGANLGSGGRKVNDDIEDFAALRRDKAAWEDELRERRAWDATLSDGLED